MRCPRCDRELTVEDRFCGRCGLARSTDGKPVDPLIGITVAGRYAIIERIGVGGMGTVYRGTHVRCGQSVAIKVLHERYASDEKLIRRFEKEALSYGQVSHPNLVGLHDYGQTSDGMCFMVLDYCPGTSLAKLIREQGHLAPPLAADIVLQIAQALGAAHVQGIIHRDLKPENVILMETSPGRYHARLLDFGIAKRTGDNEPRLTQAGMVFGTPEYMAPEQARGQNVDGRSDLYALGTMLYELLVGEPPFVGTDKLQIMSQQAHQKPQPPSERISWGEIPAHLEAITLQCLEKDPDHRFQDCNALIKALDQAMNNDGGHAVGLESGIMSSASLTDTVRAPEDSIVLRPSDITLTPTRPAKSSAPRRHRPPLMGRKTAAGWTVGVGIGLLMLAIWAGQGGDDSSRNAPVNSVVNQPDMTAGKSTKTSQGMSPSKPTDPTVRAVASKAKTNQDALALAARKAEEKAKKEKAAKQARRKKRALAKARKALRAGQFGTVQTMTRRVLTQEPTNSDAKRLRARAGKAKKALLAAKKAFKRADCVTTLAQLKPAMRHAPKARAVT